MSLSISSLNTLVKNDDDADVPLVDDDDVTLVDDDDVTLIDDDDVTLIDDDDVTLVDDDDVTLVDDDDVTLVNDDGVTLVNDDNVPLEDGVTDDINNDVNIVNVDQKKVAIQYNNLVISGGGVKGIAALGSLMVMDQRGLLDAIDCFAGSSIGAFILALYLIGYTIDEIRNFTMSMDLTAFSSNISLNNLINHYGFDTGEATETIIKKMLAEKCSVDITMKELYDKTKKRLIITATCVDNNEIVYIDHATHPDLPVWLAVRISTSVPLFYKPVLYRGKTYVDGGLVDNFPIHLFDKDDATIGIYIHNYNSNNITSFERYIMGLFSCLIYGFTNSIVDSSPHDIIGLHLPCINIVDFNISDSTKRNLFTIGYDAAHQFFTSPSPNESQLNHLHPPNPHAINIVQDVINDIIKNIIEINP